ncbi:hypothetical protein ACIHDR_43285 [Nocardia sp. NPDC052278]|uniref:hypothetical protein n=1 Tax=unclassified Nocardia TaxID=2637762 RepID=UPI003680EC80
MTDHLPPEVSLDAADGNPMPRTAEFIMQLTRECGAEYTMTLAAAVEFANENDQVRYMSGLNAAIDILAGACGDKSKARALAIHHVSSIVAAIHADLQSSGHHSATGPDFSLPHGRRHRPGEAGAGGNCGGGVDHE